jgi:hypothetical protein
MEAKTESIKKKIPGLLPGNLCVWDDYSSTPTMTEVALTTA